MDCCCFAGSSQLPTTARNAPCASSSKCPTCPSRLRFWIGRPGGAFDRLAFDLDARGPHLPLVVLNEKAQNIRGPSFALPSYVGAEGAGGEGIACLAAVVSGTLAGVDKHDQRGRDWVRMCQEWYNDKNGQKTVLNGPLATTGGSFWYEILPGMLFCQLVDRYPHEQGMDAIMPSTADRWREACWRLGGRQGRADFDWTAFNLATMTPVFNGRWRAGRRRRHWLDRIHGVAKVARPQVSGIRRLVHGELPAPARRPRAARSTRSCFIALPTWPRE